MADQVGNDITSVHQVSRRRFLAIGGVGVASFAALGLAACTNSPSTAQGSASASSTPRKGGTLIASFDSDLSYIGTAGWGLTQYTIGYAQFSRLLRVANGQTLEPELLAEMPVVDKDGTRHSYVLRQGVKFHDGTEKAQDVKFSLERAMDPNSGQSAQSLFTPLGITGTEAFTTGKATELSGIKVTGDYEFEINLDEPNSALMGALSLPMASIVPAAYVRKVGNEVFEQQKPIGSGPYRVVSYEPGSKLVFERFADYFDPERGGYVDGVQFDLNVDPNLAVLRIQKNQQHLMQGPIPTGSLAALRGNPATKEQIHSGKVNNTFFAALNLKHPAMSKLEVRQAIAYATDKDKMARQLGGSDGVGSGGLFTPLSPYYQEGLAYEYNPEKARELLSQAGFADGFDVTILSQDSEPHKTLCQALAADLNAVGIRAVADPLPQTRFNPEVTKSGPVIVINQWELAYPHGSYIIDSTFTQGAIDAGCCNFSSFSDATFEKLAKEGRTAQTVDEQVRIYKEIDTFVVRDQALWNPLLYQGYNALVAKDLQNYTVPAIEGDVLMFSDYWLSS